MATARIQLRRDTASAWTTANTVLNAGELGLETDTSKIKVGDGTNSWQNLSYIVYPKAFSDLTSTPTTIAGYGITDAFDGAFGSLSGKPTTVAGYGITDALTSVSFAQVTAKPTTVAGYGITDAFDGAFSSLTGKPTTLSGYSITDAAPLASPTFTGTPAGPTATSGTNTTQFATTAFVQTALSGHSSGANVSVSASAPSSPAAGDLWFDSSELILYVYYADGDSNQWVQTNPSSIQTGGFDGVFSSLTGKPTTISGYGITDAASTNSPSFTGTPSAPTAASGTNTGQLATTAFVRQEITGGTYSEKTSNYTASAGDKLIVDTSSAVTITLPASASLGDEIRIIDGTGNAATNNITVARNGHNIESAASNLTIDLNRAAFGLVYYNTAQGWVLTER